MKYIRFKYCTPYVGTEDEEYVAFEDNVDNMTLEDWTEEGANDNGQNWEYLAEEYDPDEEPEDYKRNIEEYWEGVYGIWEEVTEEEWRENNGYVK